MKTFKTHQLWIYYLTVSWLFATFEHNYYTLHVYTHNVTLMGMPISGITTFLMVLALDLSIFWSVMFIPTARIWNIPIRGAQAVLTVSTIISVLLNVRYMITASPTKDWFDIMIAVTIGILVPTFVVIFGWIEGNVALNKEFVNNETEDVLSRVNGNGNGNGNYKKRKDVTTEAVVEYFKNNKEASLREAADHFETSTTTILNRLKEAKEKQIY